MISIKLFAFLSFFPCLFPLKKIIRREDLNCWDLLIIMHTLYFSLIPLFLDPIDIAYKSVRTQVEVQFEAFIVYNLTVYLMLTIDVWFTVKKRSKNSLINTTFSIRNWYQNQKLSNTLLIILIIINVFLWYQTFGSYETMADRGVGTMESIREYAREHNTIVSQLIGANTKILKLFSAVLLLMYYCKNHRSEVFKPLIFYSLSISILVLYLQSSRTYLLEVFCFLSLVLYSLKKDVIKKKSIIKFFVGCILIVSIVFPFITFYRLATRISIINGKQISFVETVNYGLELLDKKQISFSQSDNKSERAWNIYQIYALAVDKGLSNNGFLTVEAISYGLPKFIYPNKSTTGSQGAIERQLGLFDDVADSIVLFAVMENKLLSPLYANLLFLLIFKVWNCVFKFYNRISTYKLGSIYCISNLFIFVFRIEYSIDGVVSSILSFIVGLCIIEFFARVCYKSQKTKIII